MVVDTYSIDCPFLYTFVFNSFTFKPFRNLRTSFRDTPKWQNASVAPTTSERTLMDCPSSSSSSSSSPSSPPSPSFPSFYFFLFHLRHLYFLFFHHSFTILILFTPPFVFLFLSFFLFFLLLSSSFYYFSFFSFFFPSFIFLSLLPLFSLLPSLPLHHHLLFHPGGRAHVRGMRTKEGPLLVSVVLGACTTTAASLLGPLTIKFTFSFLYFQIQKRIFSIIKINIKF